MTQTRAWILPLSFLLSIPAAYATRPVISLEQSIQRTPIIFEADVLDFKTVAAPATGGPFAYGNQVMEVTFTVSKSWKGDLKSSGKAYTWALGSAPCTGVEIKKSTRYLFYAEWDEAKKNLVFDFCNGLRPSRALYTEEDFKILKRLYP